MAALHPAVLRAARSVPMKSPVPVVSRHQETLTQLPDYVVSDKEPPPLVRKAKEERQIAYNSWLASRLAVFRHSRRCADVSALVLLSFCASIAALAATVMVGLGDPKWLENEVDYNGRLCGTAATKGQPLVYWPQPPDLSAKICVSSCPTPEDVVNSQTVRVPQAAALRVFHTDQWQRLELRQQLFVLDVPVYPTYQALGRFCLPPPTALLVRFGASGETGSPEQWQAQVLLLSPLHESMGTLGAQLRRFLGDVRRASSFPAAAVASVVVAWVASLLLTLPLLRFPICWLLSILATTSVCGVVSGSMLLVFARRASGDFGFSTLAGGQAQAARVAGWLFLSLGALSVCLGWAWRRPAARAARLASLALSLLTEPSLRQLALVPVLLVLVQLPVLLLLMSLAPSAAAIFRLESVASVPPSGASDCHGDAWGEPCIWPTAPVIQSMYRTLRFFDTPFWMLLIVLALAARLWVLFTAECARFVIIELFSRWYFTEPHRFSGKRAVPKFRLFASIWLILRYHVGSLSRHALQRTALPFRNLLQGAAVLASSRGACAVLHVKATWQRRFLGFISRSSPSATVGVALRSENLAESQESAEVLLDCALPAIQTLLGWGTVLGSLPSLTAALPVAAVGALSAPEESQLGASLLLLYLSHTTANSLALLQSTMSDTLLYSAALDDAAHRSFSLSDPEAPLQLKLSPKVNARTAYSLWASHNTPAQLREFLFRVSEQTRKEDEEEEEEEEEDGTTSAT